MAQAPPDDGTFSGAVRAKDVTTLHRIMKLTNLVNAGLLITAGILTFVTGSLNLIKVLAAIYVIVFSLLILGFELHLKRFDRTVFTHFGFMYSWSGRVLFYIFVGTLCFGLGVMGIIAGIYTVLNMIWNVYVVRTHPLMKGHITAGDKERTGVAEAGTAARSQAMHPVASAAAPHIAAAAAPHVGQTVADAAAPHVAAAAVDHVAKNPEAVAAAAGSAVAAAGQQWPESADWEEYTDDATGRQYYVSSAGVTTWEKPPGFGTS